MQILFYNRYIFLQITKVMAIWASYLFIFIFFLFFFFTSYFIRFASIKSLKIHLFNYTELRSLTNIKTYKHNSFWIFFFLNTLQSWLP